MKLHNSVCSKYLINILKLNNFTTILDCTFGTGNHSKIILENTSSNSKLYCIDYDIQNKTYYNNISNLKSKFLHMNFCNASNYFSKLNIKFDLLLFDFGIHDVQMIDNCSYMNSKDLNVNFDNTFKNHISAYYILNNFSVFELMHIFDLMSEDKQYKSISRQIHRYRKTRKIEKMIDLINIVKTIYYGKYINKCLGRIIQALRIFVNKEIQNIVNTINELHKICSKECIIMFISFHSIEDRIIKNFSKNRLLCYGNERLFKFLKLSSNYCFKVSKSTKHICSGIDDSKRPNLLYKLRILYS